MPEPKIPVNDLARAGYPGVAGYNELQEHLVRLAGRKPIPVTFDKQSANYGQGAQMALVDQIRASAGGSSIASMQGAGALGRNAQQALAASASGQRGVLGVARGAASGIAEDAAQANLKELLQRQALASGVAGAARGADLATAGKYSELALRQMAQDEANRQAAARIGQGLYGTQADLAREIDKLNMRRLMAGARRSDQGADSMMQAGAVIAKLAGG